MEKRLTKWELTKAFVRQAEELLNTDYGRFALVAPDGDITVWDTCRDAHQVGYERYELGVEFHVYPITEERARPLIEHLDEYLRKLDASEPTPNDSSSVQAQPPIDSPGYGVRETAGANTPTAS